MAESNPLEKFYRQPALYLSLPSKGRWWKDGSIYMPPNNELPVLPMNGKDDMALRTADGLMNGASTVSVLQSCIPNIKDAWEMPSIDLDAAMIAIRIASYGNKMDFDTKCTKCNEELNYEVDLSGILQSINVPDYDKPVEINKLLFYFRPSTFAATNEVNQEEFVHQRTMQTLTDPNITDDQKREIFKKAVEELTTATVVKLSSFIDYIITPTGDKVIDRNAITEFVQNADQKTFTAIRDALGEFNKAYNITPVQVKCNKCGHEEPRKFEFDPSNFFG